RHPPLWTAAGARNTAPIVRVRAVVRPENLPGGGVTLAVRARSSAGQSSGLIIRWSLVRIQAGPRRSRCPDSRARSLASVRPPADKRRRVPRGAGRPHFPGGPSNPRLGRESYEHSSPTIADDAGRRRDGGGRGHRSAQRLGSPQGVAERPDGVLSAV